MPLEDRELRTSGSAPPPSPGNIDMGSAAVAALPDDALILIPTRNLVLFPGTVLPITLGRQRSVLAAQTAMRLSRTVGLVLQRDAAIDDPIPVDLHRMGTEASLLSLRYEPRRRSPRDLPGRTTPSAFSIFSTATRFSQPGSSKSRRPRRRQLILPRGSSICAIRRSRCSLLPQTPAELVNAVQSVTSAAALADLIASFMDITPPEKQEILETVDIERRLERVSEMLAYRIEVLRLSRQISEQTKGKIDDRQRELLLREQMRTIQKELGEGEDAKAQEIAELTKKVAEAKMPPEVEEHVKREPARLERMPEASGEYSMTAPTLSG